MRWTAASLGLAVLLWVPVFADQFGGGRGNLTIILESFQHPSEPPVGLGTAWRLLLLHLSPSALIEGDRSLTGSVVPGAALLAAWAAAAVAAARLRDRTLIRLHVVVAASLMLGLVAISRIFAVTWF